MGKKSRLKKERRLIEAEKVRKRNTIVGRILSYAGGILFIFFLKFFPLLVIYLIIFLLT